MLTVTKRLEFDAGHRIPDHSSVCRNLHGHRYALELTLSGELVDAPGDPANGMLLDFADAKRLARDTLVDAWDHAFLVYEGDRQVLEFLRSLPDHKTVVLDCVPTAENLVRRAYDVLAPAFAAHYPGRLRLHALKLYETPNSWAEYRPLP